ncbi:uncharacterized protein B0P05DRAFT_339067 [Gilbertella persicaria]|nr:uncharacterized protein B0P05DRAFT_339067 [Gilbertella persicaria]KAI8048779.1 hypothetical protein B0P05DRAFT_339067 [Gilbertella persicaria]
MRFQVLIALSLFLILMGILGFAPIHLSEQVNDKILHFFIFFILAVFLYFLWNLSVKRNLILATSSLLVLAIGSEFIQGLLPYRSFDIYDIIANLLGGITGICLSSLTDYLINRHRENKRRFGGRREAEYQKALMEFTDEEEEQSYRLDHV